MRVEPLAHYAIGALNGRAVADAEAIMVVRPVLCPLAGIRIRE